MMFWLAYCLPNRPVAVSPVNAILAIRGLDARGWYETVDPTDNRSTQGLTDLSEMARAAPRHGYGGRAATWPCHGTGASWRS